MTSPRERFEKGPHAKAWADVAASDAWAEAAHTALAQMIQGSEEGNFHSRITGAREVIDILSNLGTPAAQRPKQKTLNHQA